MKHALVLALIVAASVPLEAQAPVLVTATVTAASNSAPYASGTYQIQLVDANGNLIPSSGLPVSYSGSLNSSGALSVSLYPNSAFVSGSQWKFTICSQTPNSSLPITVQAQKCFSQAVTITGAGDISATLSASAPNIYYFNPVTGAIYANFPAGAGVNGQPISPSSVTIPGAPSGSYVTADGTGSNTPIKDSLTDPTGVACTSAAPILRYTSGGVSTMFSCTGSGGTVYAAMAGGGGGPFLPLTGGTLTGALAGPSINTLVNATTYAGADIGAKVTAACAANQGATILIPIGSYSFSTEMVTTNCTVKGYGRATDLTFTGTGPAIYANGYVNAPGPGANTFLYDFALTGNLSSGSDCIQINDMVKADVGGVFVTGCPASYAGVAIIGDGQGPSSGADTRSAHIHDSYINANHGSGIRIAGPGGSENTVVENNNLSANYEYCISAVFGTQNGINQISTPVILANYMYACGLGAVQIDAALGGSIEGNAMGLSGTYAPIYFGPSNNYSKGMSIKANLISCGSASYAVYAPSQSLQDITIFSNDLNGCNASYYLDKTSVNVSVEFPSCSGVVHSVPGSVQNFKCTDQYGGYVFNGAGTSVTGIDTQNPGAALAIGNSGAVAIESAPLAETNLAQQATTGGTFLGNTVYYSWLVYIDALGGRSPLGASYSVQTSAGTNTNTLTSYWTNTALAASYEVYCSTFQYDNVPTLCGVASAGDTHVTMTAPGTVVYPRQTTSFASKISGTGGFVGWGQFQSC